MSHLAWEEEYRTGRLVTMDDKPQASVKTFLRWLKKQDVVIGSSHVLDVGSGTGRNANYLAGLGAEVTGIEIAPTAVDLARQRAQKEGVPATYHRQSMGEPWPVADASIDVVLDVTSSNALNEAERAVYLAELQRAMKPGGYLFLRTLCKDGDKNAKRLLTDHPGPEKDTYRMPELHLVERVFSKQDLLETYKDFDVRLLKREFHYPMVSGRRFKRAYWIAYLQKPGN